MTEQEICNEQKANGNSKMYLQLRGTFWNCYDGGAFVIARIMNYQVKRLKTVDRYKLGFSKAALEKVLCSTGAEGVCWNKESDLCYTFSGGDPTIDPLMASDAGDQEVVVNTTADYRMLCNLRKELLDINLAEASFTELKAKVRSLQVACLAHLPI